jgi:hypothetical protein
MVHHRSPFKGTFCAMRTRLEPFAQYVKNCIDCKLLPLIVWLRYPRQLCVLTEAIDQCGHVTSITESSKPGFFWISRSIDTRVTC